MVTVAEVVKLDRGFPLVRLNDGSEIRCKHATALVKGKEQRAVIGDKLVLEIPETHDVALIQEILPRRNEFVRKDPTERALPQVLAANFDQVIVAQPVSELNIRRLERELVLAYETQAQVSCILTKADLAQSDEEIALVHKRVTDLAGDITLVVISESDPTSRDRVLEIIPSGHTAILLGRSGVGKSSLVNLLVGQDIQAVSDVREGDGKGRHTTVSREIITLPNGGRVIDMPGVRGLGLWDAKVGIESAFSDIEQMASKCRFRDCKHINEPGCAVIAALQSGVLSQARYDSYQALIQETREISKRREEAARIKKRTGHPRRKSSRR